MIATPRYRPNEIAPAEDVYIAVDSSGEVLSIGVRREQGEKLPELVALDSKPVGYIRVGEVEAILTAR
jgi:hypothetical protein